MEIEVEKGILDLDNESAINIERTNPLFNEQGSMSLPFSIKRTLKNDYLLDFPHKYERKNIFDVKREANIRSGLLNENASLEILSVDSEKVESVFYLYESSFYSRVKEVKLTTVFDGIERWFQPKKELTEEERVEYVSHILDMFEQIVFGEVDTSREFTVFPAAVECELSPKSLGNIGVGKTTPQNVINEVYLYYQEGNNVPEKRFRAKYPYSYEDSEGNAINVPAGYGASPFLRFNYVLKRIFEYFGLTLLPNIFDLPEYSRMIVVNNTMDAIIGGYLIESQLVPDCTVNEFLDIIREGFCADFKIDTSEKTVEIIFFNDVVAAEPDMDLTPFIMAPFEKIEINKPKQVKLTIDRSLPFTETAADTLEEFKKKYSDYNSIPPEGIIGANGIYPIYLGNSIWKYSEPEVIWGWGIHVYKADRLSSISFDYDTVDDIEREGHKVPYQAVSGIHLFTDDGKVLPGQDPFERTYLMPIIGSKRNMNSFVILDGVKQEEDQPECPIIILLETVFSGNIVGVMSDADGLPSPPIGYPFASLHFWGTVGLFAKFWKKYDELSRVSFHQITYNLRLPARLIQSFRFDKLKIVNGQPLFPVSLKYQMQNNDYIDVEMLFKTVKLYGANSPGEYPLDPEELDYFIGQWHLVPDFEASPLLMFNLIMIQNHSGSINLRNSDGVVVNTTFSGASIKLVVTENELEYKVITLDTEHDPLSFYVMSQQTEPEKKFQLLGDKLGGWVKQW